MSAFASSLWALLLLFCAVTRGEQQQVTGTNVTENCTICKQQEFSVENISKMLLVNFDLENITGECKQSIGHFESALKKLDLWSLNMLDANARLSSGILSGNLNQYGDFDQCLEVSTTTSEEAFDGKYCLAQIMIEVPDEIEFLKFLKNRVLALNIFVSDFTDPTHVVAHSSEINFAFCIPSSCTSDDLEKALAAALGKAFEEVPVKFSTQVKEEMCQTKSKVETSMGNSEVTVIVLFALYALFLATSTILDHLDLTANPYVHAFSLKANFKELTALEPTKGDIPVVHFVRAVSAFCLLIGHKAFELAFSPNAHKIRLVKFLMHPYNLIFHAAYPYTDIFIFVSGFLTAASLLRRLKAGGRVSVSREILGRYLRLMPPIGALILFTAFIAPRLGTGPLWPMIIDYQASLCRRTWPYSLLMAQNFIGLEQICMMHTHHVATDFQLFLIAPLLVTVLWKHPKRTLIGMAVVGGVATVARFWKIYTSGLSLYVQVGSRLRNMMEVADTLYILPHYRVTVYLIGIAVAFVLAKRAGQRFGGCGLVCGWLVAVVCSAITVMIVLAIDKVNVGLPAALYASVTTLTVAVTFAWIIATCEMRHNDILAPFFAWKGWKLVSNLSYAMYLVQFSVFHFNVARVRGSSPSSPLETTFDLNELTMIFSAAVMLTICVDYPFKNLKYLLLDRKKEAKNETKKET